jgi:hypothetical protein
MEVISGRRPNKPTTSNGRNPPHLEQLWSTIQSCWQARPEDRPDMSTVLAELNAADDCMSRECLSMPMYELDPSQSMTSLDLNGFNALFEANPVTVACQLLCDSDVDCLSGPANNTTHSGQHDPTFVTHPATSDDIQEYLDVEDYLISLNLSDDQDVTSNRPFLRSVEWKPENTQLRRSCKACQRNKIKVFSPAQLVAIFITQLKRLDHSIV